MEWAVSQCKSNAEKLRMNMFDSNGTVNFYMESWLCNQIHVESPQYTYQKIY